MSSDYDFCKWLTQRKHYEFDKSQSRLDNIRRAQKRASYEHKGQKFQSLYHLNCLDTETEARTCRVLKTCEERGMFYFKREEISWDPVTKKWAQKRRKRKREEEEEITVPIICVDKIKVMTAPLCATNMMGYHALMGVDGTQEQRRGKKQKKRGGGDVNVFVHEVVKVTNPMATIARYKRSDPSHQMHAHHVVKANRNNINMPRGMHEYVRVNRIITAHYLANTFPHGRMHIALSQDSEHNNSLTVDSLFDSIINGLTFKANATKLSEHSTIRDSSSSSKSSKNSKSSRNNADKSANQFALAPLASFGTHQVLVNGGVNKVQVHDHCVNCSAVPGPQIIGEIAKKACQILSSKDIHPKIIVSTALSKCKAFLSTKSRSLMWNVPNAVCDFHCWKYKTHTMTPEEENTFFETRCKPILDSLLVSRDNFAQTGMFCQQPPLAGSLFTQGDVTKCSHRFENKDTRALFRRNRTRFPELYLHHVRKRNSKTPLTACGRKMAKNPKLKDYRADTLAPTMARNAGIVKPYEIGPLVFREEFDMTPPRIDQV